MLQQLTAFIIFISFVTQTFNKFFIVADYYTNTSSFAKNCENKQKPMLHCNGKCQMMKKLKQEENKDQQNPNRKSNNKDEVLSSKSFFATVKLAVLSFQITHPYQNISLTIARNFAIFHPPQGSILPLDYSI